MAQNFKIGMIYSGTGSGAHTGSTPREGVGCQQINV
jgi:hypothetical protein